jgi:N-ethylmaleimide reductase
MLGHSILVIGDQSTWIFHYTKETGEAELEKGTAQIISYGTLFLANPDLPRRFELNAPLNEADRATMYGGKDAGYIDYLFLINNN